MNKKWLLATALLFGASGAWAGEAAHKVVSGETLGTIAKQAGYDWKGLCSYNGLANCNLITVGQTIRFPGRDVAMKRSSQPAVSQACITLGVAPFNPEHNLARTLQGIDLLTTLSPEQKAVAKEKVVLGEKATSKELVGRQIFNEMLYQSKTGKVVHIHDKPICSPEEGGQPEVMDTYDLGGGIFLADPRRCGNPSTFTKVVIAPPPVTVSKVPEPELVPTMVRPEEPVVPLQEQEAEQVARDYDWDLGFFIGGDKDVRYAGGEGAGYPVIKYYDWGRYALGGGGSFSLWNGGTPDGYRYSGETAAFGLAQKFSFNNRRDVGIKFPMIGGLWERGHDASGQYQQKRYTSLWCASASYTDASREKDGEKWVPEWQLWASFCDPFSQTKSHSWEGKALDASTIPDTKYILGVGGRVFLSKNLGNQGLAAKLQPFVEVGANKTAPNPTSGHAYVGLRTVNKVWGLGAGPHFADIGNTLGATLTYGAGRHYKLHVQEERWNAMIRSLEALGVAID